MPRISSTAIILVVACATYAATLSHTFFNTQPRHPTEPEPENHRLKKVFDSIINGDWQLNRALIPHFIKSIATHPYPAARLDALVTSEHGLKAVQIAVSSDFSSEFLNDGVATFLAYLRDSKLEYLRGGDTLQRLLRALVEAPGFWNSLVTAVSKGRLQRSAERSFSWLFLQLVVSPPQLAGKFRRAALDTEIVQTLLRSLDSQTRSNARKINHIVSLFRSNDIVPLNWLEAPGWRHNNDLRSYLDVSILPTPEEVNSTERPSLRTVDEINRLNLTSPAKMFEVHIENQFRLLREDLVRDTRDNVQVLFGKKKGKRTGVFIEDISLTKVYTNEKSKWGLEFGCKYDLPIFPAMDEGDRKDHLERDRNFLRHGSFACLLSRGEVVAFLTIVRDIDLLVRSPPVIVAQLGGRQSAKDALDRLRRCPSVSLAQINTPLFAYEPVLRSLQAMEPIRFLSDKYNCFQAPISDKFQEKTRRVLRSKRIIACTTTGASIYRDAIHDAGPEILVVEEAGEVLESHVLTALSNNTQRLILIGDHKQLRPRVNGYGLTVEKGDGYDLNRSLFERLIIEGHPYRSLSKQHRMRPEISALVRALTYPNLTDGPHTGSRPLIRGLQNTVIFIDHKYREDDVSTLSDPRHLGVTTSKRNKFEVDMVVRIVKYLKQQGYGTGEMTVLTPYLGQLVLLRETLETVDRVMFGERDTEQLEVAGLTELLGTPALGDQRKQNLKVSTIDNYQGEENDIVIASLTRSNEEGNIGFMSSPERLNVLLSRARNGLIIVGNSDAFLRSQSGNELWTKFFDMVKRRGHFYEGLPVRCDRHSVKNVVRSPEDFSRLCPDGGCSEPCRVVMSCGVHTCPRKCHKSKDHEGLVCTVKAGTVLSCGHTATRSCNGAKGSPNGCAACKLAQRRAAGRPRSQYGSSVPSRGGFGRGNWQR